MFRLNDSIRYWLYSEPADMRMGFNGLGGLVANRMGGNILGGDAFCFLNRRRDLLKILRWEPGGLVMYSKRLEKGTFKPPRDSWGKGVPSAMGWSDLVVMVEGIRERPGGRRTRYNPDTPANIKTSG